MKMIFLKWTSSHAMLSVFFHCPSTPAHKLLSIFSEVLQDPPWLTFLATSALAVLPIRALATLPLQNGSLSLSTWNITPLVVNSSSVFKPSFRLNSVGHPSYPASTPGRWQPWDRTHPSGYLKSLSLINRHSCWSKAMGFTDPICVGHKYGGPKVPCHGYSLNEWRLWMEEKKSQGSPTIFSP